MTRRAVFLDRDGVINRAALRKGRPHPPSSLAELEILPQVSEALHMLREANFRLIVVTNQPDVAKGVQRKQVVESIHGIIRQQLQVDSIKVCYHVDEDGCNCRKPKPGMILDAAREYSIDLAGSFLIGDRWRDIEAGKAAGCKTILVQPEVRYNEPQAQGMNAVVNSLYEAATLILRN